MVITINENPADISMENEKNLQEVIDGIDSWLKQEGYFLSSAMLNGKAISINDPELKNTPLAKIEQLDILAYDLNELLLENVGTIYQFLYLFKLNLGQQNSENIKGYLEELPHILDSIDPILGNNDSSFGSNLKKYIEQADFKDGIAQGDSDSLNSYLNTLILFLEGIIREKTDPVSEFIKTVKALDASMSRVKEVAVLLQTGKDKEAMDIIIAFTELSGKMTRLYPGIEEQESSFLHEIELEGKTSREFYEELNSFLSELLEAFETEDSVLIGDLLEYEIAPRIEILVSGILTIQKNVGN